MNSHKKQYTLIALLTLGILIIDQIIKIVVKTNMQIGESIPVFGTWFQILFVENEGMAFGMAFGGAMGKLLLSLFRIVAAIGLMWYLVYLIKHDAASKGMLCSLTLIFAGAIGNLIDSAFYGLIFDESYYHIARLFPPEGGYGTFLHGRVVDMFYFPIIDTYWPSWMPFVGGQHFTFFNAIFNFADSAITIGVVWLLVLVLFYNKKSSKSDVTEEKIK